MCVRKNAENFLVAQFLTESECCEFAVLYKDGGDLQRLESLAFVTRRLSEKKVAGRSGRVRRKRLSGFATEEVP